MKKFYIDFESYVAIKAENKEQAIAKFWKLVVELQDKTLIGTLKVDGIEERME